MRSYLFIDFLCYYVSIDYAMDTIYDHVVCLYAYVATCALLERRPGEQLRSSNSPLHRNIANHSNMQEATEALASDSTRTRVG